MGGWIERMWRWWRRGIHPVPGVSAPHPSIPSAFGRGGVNGEEAEPGPAGDSAEGEVRRLAERLRTLAEQVEELEAQLVAQDASVAGVATARLGRSSRRNAEIGCREAEEGRRAGHEVRGAGAGRRGLESTKVNGWGGMLEVGGEVDGEGPGDGELSKAGEGDLRAGQPQGLTRERQRVVKTSEIWEGVL